MTTYAKLNETCYSCNKSGENLVSACGDEKCDSRFHRECLFKQVVEDEKDFCIKCSKDIISNKTTELNYNNCYNILSTILFNLILSIIGLISPWFAIFGMDSINPTINTGNLLNTLFFVPSGLIAIIIGLTFPYFVIISLLSSFGGPLPYHIEVKKEYLGEKYWPYNTPYIVLLFIYVIIFSLHFFGFFILKCIFNLGYHFDKISFMTGVLLVICVITLYFLSKGVYAFFKIIYENSLEERVVYGV